MNTVLYFLVFVTYVVSFFAVAIYSSDARRAWRGYNSVRARHFTKLASLYSFVALLSVIIIASSEDDFQDTIIICGITLLLLGFFRYGIHRDKREAINADPTFYNYP